MICPNCGSDKHRRCCARCGVLLHHSAVVRGVIYCTNRCARDQARADERSAQLEKEARR